MRLHKENPLLLRKLVERSGVHLHQPAVAVEKILCQAKEQVVIVAAAKTQLRAQQHGEMLLLKRLAAAVTREEVIHFPLPRGVLHECKGAAVDVVCHHHARIPRLLIQRHRLLRRHARAGAHTRRMQVRFKQKALFGRYHSNCISYLFIDPFWCGAACRADTG